MSDNIARSIGSGRFLEWKAMNAEGASGGILMCWDKRSLEILDWEEGQFTLSCRFQNIENGAIWIFTGVYGLFSKMEREALWDELGAIRGLWEDPWCIGGDFNITLFPRERSSQRRMNSAMRKFAEIVDDLGLMDLPLQGGEFTWNGGQNNQVWARLDRGSGSYKLATKMKEVKQKLKVWNREVFGKLETNKSLALQQVEFWDREESGRILTVEETELKKEAKDNYRKWVIMEETHWRQLSREIWLKEGDRNTGFFHRMASAHQDMGWKADIGGLRLDQISQQEAETLERPFSEEEIYVALMEMNGDKAPDFYDHSSFLKSLNNTFLVLIPKKSGAEDLRDFRPISLLGGLYKLLAKVLANRLKKVVGKVVSTSQNAFVKGRQILDASLIANEVIDTWQKQKEKGIICKLDIEKAYDSINWKFLVKVLQKMGFGSKWMGWMWSCLSLAKFSVLVNGVPAGFFPSTKGLRQGDPLSPYLFIMGMEVLDVLIRRAVEGGFLSGCNIRGGSAASGLRINLAKSEVIPVGEVVEVEELVVELGCRVGTLPSQYLGLPLGAPNRAPYIWDGVEERVRRRLALWKRQYISKGGRVTLIKRGNMERKVHLVKWEVVCTDKDKGGLGLRKLALLNKALLGKWIWRPKKGNGAVGVGVWKEIWKESDWCWDNMTFRVGKGNMICFWTDVWCSDSSLAQCFPHLFGMAAHQSLTVEEMWDQNSGQGNWNLHFLRTSMIGRLSWLGSSSTF
ncbi:LINE-1 reverse transcriptase-like [Vitis vinifera]|uniref:LINE-1 reverse transcriptase-like n=1 Tax=Vitis vinifera TaxID=29760 RepID=A0A438G5C8_VITVI|nr:LINE-1 reverse transcriptase-like [Vitis vinifera]